MDGHLVLLSALDKCVPFCLPVMANTSTDTQNKLSLDRRGKRRMSTRNGKKETLKRPERKCISAHMQKSMHKVSEYDDGGGDDDDDSALDDDCTLPC